MQIQQTVENPDLNDDFLYSSDIQDASQQMQGDQFENQIPHHPNTAHLLQRRKIKKRTLITNVVSQSSTNQTRGDLA
jgi:hypothetical protein